MIKIILIAAFLTMPLLVFAENSTDNPNYQLGAEHGCSSAKNNFIYPFIKDANKYLDDKYYKLGWDDAYLKCKQENDTLNKIFDESWR